MSLNSSDFSARSPDIIVHMLRKTKHDLVYTVFFDQLLNTCAGSPQLILFFSSDRFYCLGCKTERIADSDPDRLSP